MKNKTSITAASAGLIALMLAVSPLSVFAKEKTETKFNYGKAFGHLIAPGWAKKNGTSTEVFAWLPAGIAKKLGLGTSTGSTTLDVTAPLISSVYASPSATLATVKWTTDEKSDSTVFYATSSAALSATSSVSNVTKTRLVSEHSVKLTNLSASTTYYFKVSSEDRAGNVSYSPVMSFTTTAAGTAKTYPVISNTSVIAGTSTISLGWKTSEPTTSKVYYGLVGTIDVNSTSTERVSDPALATNHSVTIVGLSTSTPYSLVIEATDADGNKTFSSSMSATTGI